MKERFLNPFTDFGFKKIFGEEPNKDILIDFLNCLLSPEEQIKSLQFLKDEQLGATAVDRKAIFDLYCENEAGEKFIIELQKVKQSFFKERSVYYSTFPIQQQAKSGDWNFDLKAVYTIGILDFVFDESEERSDKLFYEVKLMDTKDKKIFYEKLTFVYLEMPKFQKKESELESRFDQWLYILRYLPKLQERPKLLKDKIFKKLFQVAEVAKLTEKERQGYEDSLKYYRDLQNSLDTARQEGIEQGQSRTILQLVETKFPDASEQDKAVLITLAEQDLQGTLQKILRANVLADIK